MTPLKIFGIGKSTTEALFEGFYYPAFLDRFHAIQADIDAGGKGLYSTYTFFNRTGEFYFPETTKVLGVKRDPLVYTLYEGQGAENPFERIKNSLSSLVPNQLPDFIRTDYENFVVFIKAYYEFLEQNNQAQEVLQNITKYADIDETAEELVEKFFKTYAESLTPSSISDNRFLIKKIRELYKKKGTETAYKILFNVLFKETIEFFYPYQIVLKPSSGKWLSPLAVRVKPGSTEQNMFDFENTEIVGSRSKARGVVNRVIKYNIDRFDVYELLMDPKTVRGEFLPNETITALKTFVLNGRQITINLSGILYSVISKVNIKDGKLGYSVGANINITDSQGQFASARIEGVDRFGSITRIEVLEGGLNYSANTKIDAGLPTVPLNGIYEITRGAVTVNFPNRHNIKIGTNIKVTYSGNIFSPVNDTSHDAVVVSIPDLRTIRFRYPGF